MAWSQTTSGSISGVVLDAQRAMIPGASVSAQEVERKFTFNTKTDEFVRYVFTQVPPGTCTTRIQEQITGIHVQ